MWGTPGFDFFWGFSSRLKGLLSFVFGLQVEERLFVRAVVLIVTFFVLWFSCFYIKEDASLVYFILMVLIFVVSIIILLLAKSVFVILIG